MKLTWLAQHAYWKLVYGWQAFSHGCFNRISPYIKCLVWSEWVWLLVLENTCSVIPSAQKWNGRCVPRRSVFGERQLACYHNHGLQLNLQQVGILGLSPCFVSSFTNAALQGICLRVKRLYVCVYYYDLSYYKWNSGNIMNTNTQGLWCFACMVICCTTQCYADIYFILMAIELITEEH